ncbi:MAG: hypothetical protein FJZ61_00570 [Chlamydiae bacterium]|nr:hypothetical protein [Chlamydiota bacterium]
MYATTSTPVLPGIEGSCLTQIRSVRLATTSLLLLAPWLIARNSVTAKLLTLPMLFSAAIINTNNLPQENQNPVLKTVKIIHGFASALLLNLIGLRFRSFPTFILSVLAFEIIKLNTSDNSEHLHINIGPNISHRCGQNFGGFDSGLSGFSEVNVGHRYPYQEPQRNYTVRHRVGSDRSDSFAGGAFLDGSSVTQRPFPGSTHLRFVPQDAQFQDDDHVQSRMGDSRAVYEGVRHVVAQDSESSVDPTDPRAGMFPSSAIVNPFAGSQNGLRHQVGGSNSEIRLPLPEAGEANAGEDFFAAPISAQTHHQRRSNRVQHASFKTPAPIQTQHQRRNIRGQSASFGAPATIQPLTSSSGSQGESASADRDSWGFAGISSLVANGERHIPGSDNAK